MLADDDSSVVSDHAWAAQVVEMIEVDNFSTGLGYACIAIPRAPRIGAADRVLPRATAATVAVSRATPLNAVAILGADYTALRATGLTDVVAAHNHVTSVRVESRTISGA